MKSDYNPKLASVDSKSQELMEAEVLKLIDPKDSEEIEALLLQRIKEYDGGCKL